MEPAFHHLPLARSRDASTTPCAASAGLGEPPWRPLGNHRVKSHTHGHPRQAPASTSLVRAERLTAVPIHRPCAGYLFGSGTRRALAGGVTDARRTLAASGARLFGRPPIAADRHGGSTHHCMQACPFIYERHHFHRHQPRDQVLLHGEHKKTRQCRVFCAAPECSRKLTSSGGTCAEPQSGPP